MTITDRDIRTQVEQALTDYAGVHDVDGIVETIRDRYGLVDIDTIDDGEFWGIVQAYAAYTVRIEASNADGTIWQPVHPAENVTTGEEAHEVAARVLAEQTVADGAGVRVRVWVGHDADTGGKPAAEATA